LRLLLALVLAGIVAVVGAPLVVYTHYPAAASEAAPIAGGHSPPFEGAVSVISGYKEASISGVVVAYAEVNGHCILLIETPRGRVIAVMPRPHPWQWNAHGSLKPCDLASKLVGAHVVARGHVRPGPRGPVLVVTLLETPRGPAHPVTPHPGGYWSSTRPDHRHGGRHQGYSGGWSG
jgi:hypothetical protein